MKILDPLNPQSLDVPAGHRSPNVRSCTPLPNGEVSAQTP